MTARSEPSEDRHADGQSAERGRDAKTPADIPGSGWRDIAWRVVAEISNDNLSMVAAGVAFYGLFAIVPALGSIVAVYGLIADPKAIQQQLQAVSGVLPADARSIIDQQLTRVTSSAPTTLGLGALIGILLTLWSANKGTKGLIEALNIAYDEGEDRNFFFLNLISLLLTLGLIVFIVVTLSMIAVLPALFGSLGLSDTMVSLARWLRWPILALVFILALAVLYRFAPSRDRPRWRWVSLGAVVSTVLWVAGSIAFSLYVSNFASYNETYGSLGAVLILMMWLWISAFIVLLGAEINAEMEHQTARDTTAGKPDPRGQRGAYVADTVGERP